jgi:putative ATP-binding cassette transporter
LGELPYLPPGTLRELLLKPLPEIPAPDEATLEQLEASDDEIFEILRLLKIHTLLTGFGGLDTRHHWENVIPLFEQKLIIIARALLSRPSFVFFDRPGTSLGPDQIECYLDMFRQRGITYVVFEERGGSLEDYNILLEIKKDGSWECRPVEDKRIAAPPPKASA